MSNSRRKYKVPGDVVDVVLPTPQRLRMIGNNFDALSEATTGGIPKKTGAIRVWSSLENLYRNGHISGQQRDAGERYYRDWYIGFQASAAVTMKWSEHISGADGAAPVMDVAERKVFHAKRFALANKMLDEIQMRKPVHWLCINDIRAEDIGRRSRGYRSKDKAQAAGTTLAVVGLQNLAKFYGLVK